MTEFLFVLDLDDTLYPEREFVRGGYQAVSDYAQRNLGLYDFLSRAWARFESGERTKIFDHVLLDLGHAPDPLLISELVSIYRNHRPRLEFYPGALAFLTKLKRTGATAVITDGPVECQNNKVEALGLPGLVDEILLTDKLGPGFSKPHPRAYQMMMDRFRIPPAACCYIADNPEKDFVAPNLLGWQSIHVVHPGQVRPLKDFADAYRAKQRAAGFEETYRVLKQLWPALPNAGVPDLNA